MGLIRFWWHCVREGWEVGDGVFAAIEAACGLCSAILLWARQAHRDKWKPWEERLMKWAAVLFVGSFVIATVIVAPWIQFKNETTRTTRLQKQLDDEHPHFQLRGAKLILASNQNDPSIPAKVLSVHLDLGNIGRHGATRVNGFIVLLPITLHGDPMSKGAPPGDFSDVVETGETQSMDLFITRQPSIADFPSCYILFQIRYIDSDNNQQSFHQSWYLKWDFHGNPIKTDQLSDITIDEKQQLIDYLRSKQLSLLYNE